MRSQRNVSLVCIKVAWFDPRESKQKSK